MKISSMLESTPAQPSAHWISSPILAFSRLFLIIIAFPCYVISSNAAEDYSRTEVIYGRKPGVALTLDVIAPTKKNGYGVLYMVSGGWFSSHEAVNPKTYAALLDRGYTVFAVVHGSQPKYTIPEITQDIHRAVRWVRFNADKYGIKANALGISGASAGGHLSLTMGTQGTEGKADSMDPINRMSSTVQAVACFFPPTDFLNYGKPGEDAVGIGILKDFRPAFGTNAATAESRQILGKQVSPIYYIHAHVPPTMIIHGDADALVPIQQAEVFLAKMREVGQSNVKLITKPGQKHGWKDWEKDIEFFADWFDEHLRGIRK